MLALLALPVAVGVALTHRSLHVHAPSNVLCRRARSAPPKWRTAVTLVALATALLAAMHGVAETVAGGASGWLNLVVLVLAWDSIKFFLVGLLVASRCVRSLLVRPSSACVERTGVVATEHDRAESTCRAESARRRERLADGG